VRVRISTVPLWGEMGGDLRGAIKERVEKFGRVIFSRCSMFQEEEKALKKKNVNEKEKAARVLGDSGRGSPTLKEEGK